MSLRGDSGHVMRLKVSGLPTGEPVDLSALSAFVRRSARENAPWNPQVGDAVLPAAESGLSDGIVSGDVTFALRSPAPAVNLKLTGIPVPGTADYVDFARYGRRMPREDTDTERRLFCAAGAVMVQLLEKRGIHIGSHLSSVGLIRDRVFDGTQVDGAVCASLRGLAFPVLDENRGMQMIQRILREKASGNSVGGQIECAVVGLPAGLGGTWFSALAGRLASGAMAVPGVNGVEFGTGFAASALKGSQTVDPILAGEGGPHLAGNISGGLLEGRTTGMPLLFRVSVQPSPAVTGETDSVDWKKNEPVVLIGKVEENDRSRGRHERPFEKPSDAGDTEGRHARGGEEVWEDRDEYLDLRTGKTVRMVETGEPDDPCPALSVLPCVEAMTACILLDELMKEESIRNGIF